MTVYTFREVVMTAYKAGKCGCGKRRSRQKRFYQTLNPFNKNADGSVKTAQDIQADLAVEAKAWRAAPITCTACEAQR